MEVPVVNPQAIFTLVLLAFGGVWQSCGLVVVLGGTGPSPRAEVGLSRPRVLCVLLSDGQLLFWLGAGAPATVMEVGRTRTGFWVVEPKHGVSMRKWPL